jgi:hypothetical protein
MTSRIRRVAVLVGTTASAQQPPGGPRGLSTADLKTLATKLGVTTTALQTAMQSARPAGRPGTASSSGPQADPRTQMAAALAKALNLSTAKVQAALSAVMPSSS